MKSTKSILLILLVLSIYACDFDQKSQKKTLKPLDFLIDWQAEPTYMGVYYAKALGEFEKIGLDINIIQSWGANQAASAIGAGKYLIGTASGGATVLAYNNGIEMVSLSVLYQKIPTVIYGLSSTHIRKPNDLLGKRIGIYPGSITKNEFDAFAVANNLNLEKIEIVSISGADIPLILSNSVDAVLNYREMSPVILASDKTIEEVDGKRTFELQLAQYGVKGYGLNIITSRDSLLKNKKMLSNITKATLNGYIKGCADSEKAVSAFLKKFPEKDKTYVEQSWNIVCDMIGANPGEQTLEGWKSTIQMYRDISLLKKDINPRDLMP